MATLENDLLRRRLCDHLPYRSSTRPSVTIPEYLRQRSERVVIYADDQSSAAALIPLYNRANVEVLYMTDAVDRLLRERWFSNGPAVEFRRVDLNPPASQEETAVARASAPDPTLLEIIRDLFRSELNSHLNVEIRDLGEDAPPAVLALDEEDRHHLTMAHVVQRMKQENRLHELPPEAQQAAKAGFFDMIEQFASQTLILNRSNGIVDQFIAHLTPIRRPPPREQRTVFRWLRKEPHPTTTAPDLRSVCPLIARFLYGQALLSSGLPLTNEKLTGISQNQTALISTLLTHLKPQD
jgi:HSP90 family molecular chaperone